MATSMSTASILGTQLAWRAGHKALSYFGITIGKDYKEYLNDFILDSRGLPTYYMNKANYLDKEGKISGQKEIEAEISQGLGQKVSLVNSYDVVSFSKGDINRFYTRADDPNGGYITMYLRNQGDESNDNYTATYLAIPCVNGSPKISMHVAQNEMPIASNDKPATTNRRVKPRVWKFSFPIAYLKIYGKNNASDEIIDTRNKLQKIKDSAKEKYNELNPIGFLDMNIDRESNRKKERAIPTYEETINLLSNFTTQFGCWFYMGIGTHKIGVTCSFDITSQRDNMDCIWVDLTLVETMEIDFNTLLNANVSDFINVPAYQNGSVGSSTNTKNNTEI